MQIGAKAIVSCLLGTNYIFIPGLYANQGDNCGPTIEMGQSSKDNPCVVTWHYRSGDSTSTCLFNFTKGFARVIELVLYCNLLPFNISIN